MITIVCLNPSMDKTVLVQRFAFGGMNRVKVQSIDPSGKGVNVALGVKGLGGACCCAGHAGQANANAILDKLESNGIPARFVTIPGEVRTNLKLLEIESKIVTEINEPGPAVPPEHQAQMRDTLADLARESTWLILTGSLPAGYTPDTYAHWIRLLRQTAPHCRIALDAEGAAFAHAAAEGPDLVKPNRYELELYAGAACATLKDIQSAASRLLDAGVRHVAVSMGGEGALILDTSGAWYAPALSIPVRSTVGAGDAMLAGLVHCLAQGSTTNEALRFGVAAASAVVSQEGTQPASLAGALSLLPTVQLERLC